MGDGWVTIMVDMDGHHPCLSLTLTYHVTTDVGVMDDVNGHVKYKLMTKHTRQS